MKKWLTAGAVLVCIVIGGVAFYSRYHSDRTAPEISFDNTLSYSDEMTEEELLSDVHAMDAQDGDVSDTLIIESVTINQAEQTAVIKYAARDSHNNVAKKSRTLSADTGENRTSEQDGFSESGRQDDKIGESATNEKANKETASSELVTETGAATESEIETDSETESEMETETETEITAPGAPHIKLTETHAEIKVGDSFDPLLYVATVEDDYDNIYTLWRDIQLSGDYDVNRPGVYKFSFYVVDSSGNVSNHAKFKLTVKAAD